jgi:hypothetical protein
MKKQAGADRRSFLGFLGLGTVAGPGMVKEAVSGQGFNSLGTLSAFAKPSNYGYDDDNSDTEEDDSDDKTYYTKSRIKSYVKMLNQEKTKDYSLELPKYIRRVNRLDSDLVSNRSFSLNARVRLQALRDIEIDRKKNVSRAENCLNSIITNARKHLSDNDCYDIVVQNLVKDKLKPFPTLEKFTEFFRGKDDEA